MSNIPRYGLAVIHAMDRPPSYEEMEKMAQAIPDSRGCVRVQFPLSQLEGEEIVEDEQVSVGMDANTKQHATRFLLSHLNLACDIMLDGLSGDDDSETMQLFNSGPTSTLDEEEQRRLHDHVSKLIEGKFDELGEEE